MGLPPASGQAVREHLAGASARIGLISAKIRQVLAACRTFLAVATTASLVAAGCGAPGTGKTGSHLTGTVSVPAGATGDAYLFLYPSGEGPPSRPAEPLLVTAVSSVRLAADPHFVFADVPPRPYRLWGFLDRDRSFRLDVEVLAQPSAGDLTARGVEVPALALSEPLVLDVPTPFDPPAFEIAGAGAFVVLPDQPLLPVRFSIRTTRLSGLLGQVAFAVSLVGQDLYPRVAFRLLPRPGQTAQDALIPAVIETELQLRAALAADPSQAIPLDQLPLALLPLATDSAGNPLPVIPVGEYQLVVLGASGQVWTLPNGLAESEPSQAVRFFVQHALFASGLP